MSVFFVVFSLVVSIAAFVGVSWERTRNRVLSVHASVISEQIGKAREVVRRHAGVSTGAVSMDQGLKTAVLSLCAVLQMASLAAKPLNTAVAPKEGEVLYWQLNDIVKELSAIDKLTGADTDVVTAIGHTNEALKRLPVKLKTAFFPKSIVVALAPLTIEITK